MQYEVQPAAGAQSHSDAEETQIGDYRVLRTLGRGAFGRVVFAQRADGELAAIKLLPRGERVRSLAGPPPPLPCAGPSQAPRER